MKRILVAEDRPASLELIRTILESIGHEVIEAADGQEALEKAARNSIDLFVLDLQMPKLDGFEVLKQLRKQSRFQHTPVIAITASAMESDRERVIAAGFTGYITKPVDIRFLRSEMERLLK